MKNWIIYIRRSKKEKQDAQLSLSAQMQAAQKHIATSGGKVLGIYVELESATAKRRNKRTVILEAIAKAKENNCKLLIAKIDRLTRDTEFTSYLYNTGVEFICCDNSNANELTIKILSSVAEDEAKQISKRTTAALAQRKASGLPMGCYAHKTPGSKFDLSTQRAGAKAMKEKAKSNDHNRKGQAFAKSLRKQNLSVKAIAEQMNEHGYTTSTGLPILPQTVSRWIKKRKSPVEFSFSEDLFVNA
jgi:DNA invertase Pin-like site-specific DNA recombinase